jgi:hypothetical protein
MRAADELLAVLSARHKLSWHAWRCAFDVLQYNATKDGSAIDEPITFLRYRTLRIFQELAHCDFDEQIASRVCYAAPSLLVAIPNAGLPRALLCGSRGTRAANVLRQARMSFRADAWPIALRQPYCGGYAPSPLILEATGIEVLSRIAERCAVQFIPWPAAWSLLSCAKGLDDYEATLSWRADTDPTWPRKDFSKSSLGYGQTLSTNERWRLSSYSDPRTTRTIYYLRRPTGLAAVDRHWGRWLYLSDVGTSVLRFDHKQQVLGVPISVPLPPILARSLALLSGLAPARKMRAEDKRHSLDIYCNVSHECAEVLAGKLRQNLIDAELV